MSTEERRVKLQVLGISYSQTQSGAYALILSQVNGPVKIPVVIGAAEAQSIAMRIEGVTPPRPMTHDLFAGFARAFGVQLREVFIYKFEDGIFSSELTFTDGDREVKLDSRTSDAIAIAMRTGSPIYTTRAILEETGFVMEEETEGDDEASLAEPEDDIYDDSGVKAPRLESLAVEELEKELARLIEREEYEQAARVSAILKQKRENK